MSYWQLVHMFYFIRALLRGPKYFARYEMRRQIRKLKRRARRPFYNRRYHW